jgi:hypothetical protein
MAIIAYPVGVFTGAKAEIGGEPTEDD